MDGRFARKPLCQGQQICERGQSAGGDDIRGDVWSRIDAARVDGNRYPHHPRRLTEEGRFALIALDQMG